MEWKLALRLGVLIKSQRDISKGKDLKTLDCYISKFLVCFGCSGVDYTRSLCIDIKMETLVTVRFGKQWRSHELSRGGANLRVRGSKKWQ